MNQPPKERIRQSFERAAATYDAAAQVQRDICDRLAEDLPCPANPAVILDSGCGTGYGLGLLGRLFPGAGLIGLDLSPAMLAQVGTPARRLAGDAEHLPLAPDSVDLYWSSLSLQWCRLELALAEARRVLRPGGRLAAATLGPDTFAELRTAFAAADAYRHTLAFLGPEEIETLAIGTGLKNILIRRESRVCHYPDLKSLLGAVKSIGANQVGAGRRQGLMSRGAWQRTVHAYEELRRPAGLPLTYDVIHFCAEK